MSRVLLVWNPVSTDVSLDTSGSVLVKLAESAFIGKGDGVNAVAEVERGEQACDV